MVKKMFQECPKDWDRYLQVVLFVYKEVSQPAPDSNHLNYYTGEPLEGLCKY